MAHVASTQWEFRSANGQADQGGGFAWLSLVNSTYKWTASGSGTDEFYCELSGGGDPSLPGQSGMSVMLDGFFNLATEATAGSLTAGQWDWADNDTLGYTTVYVRLADGADPDSKDICFVAMGLTGGTDYSQQDNFQQSWMNLSTSTTTLTDDDAGGNFTAAMIDNYLQDDNNEFWRIVGFSDGDNVTIDRQPGLALSGASAKLGGALGILNTSVLAAGTALIAGNTAHIETGTTTPGVTINAGAVGTVLLPITFAGYETTRGDQPTTTARPLFAMAPNALIFDNFIHMKHIRVTTTEADGLELDNDCVVENVTSLNSAGGGSPGRSAINLSSRCILSRSDLASTNGDGLDTVLDTRIIACYFHDSDVGVRTTTGDVITIIGCIFDTCATAGITTGAGADRYNIVNCTFYACGIGINVGATSDQWVIANNIFDANTTGIVWGDANLGNYMDYNCWDNTTDVSGGIAKGPNAVNGDPGLTAPASGDFTLGSGSNCIDAGLQVGVAQGAVGNYKWNIGADQDDVAGGGASSMLWQASTSGGATG